MYLRKCSYIDIVNKALGKTWKKVIEWMLAFVQFQFTIAQLAFIIGSLKSTTQALSGIKNIKQEYFALVVVAFFSPLAWVRKIEAFRVGFMLGFWMMFLTLVTISAFCI